MKRPYVYIFLAAVLLIYAFLQFKVPLNVPDIAADEAMAGSETLLIIDNIPPTAGGAMDDRTLSVTIGSRHFKISNGYHGAVQLYLTVPFIAWGGNTLEALRIGPIVFGFLIIILTYVFGARFFNPVAGVIAAFLLAINVFFLNQMRLGAAFLFAIPFFCLLSLILFFSYTQTKRMRYLYLGSLALGIGLNARFYFLWFIAALFITTLIVPPACLKIKRSRILISVLFFLAGCWTLLLFYYKVDFINTFIRPRFPCTLEGVNIFHFLQNISVRVEHLRSAMQGNMYWPALPAFYGVPFYILLAAFAYLIYATFVRKKTSMNKRRIIFILGLFFFSFLATGITFTGLWDCHTLVFFPLPQLVIAAALYELYKNSRNRAVSLLPVLAFLILSLFYGQKCLAWERQLSYDMAENEGCNTKVVIDWLRENKISSVVFLDPNIHFGAIYYSRFKYEKNFDYKFWPPILTEEKMYNAVLDFPEDANVVLTDSYNTIRTNKYFYSIVKKLNKEVVVIKEFRSNSGRIKFLVCQLK